MSQEITDQNFNQIINSNKVVVVDLGASWCGPCKALSPIIDKLSDDYKGRAVVGKLDVDKNPGVTAKFGVRNIPTILFFKNGQLVDKIGANSSNRGALVEKINALL